MPPEKKKASDPLESDQSCWPKAGVEALRKVRTAAVKAKRSSYTADVPTGTAGKTRAVTYYINYEKCPIIVEREVEEFEGAKQEQRPHKQARRGDSRRVRDALIADGHTGFDNPATAVQMPDETREEDIGWKPGPVPGRRRLPTFSGPRQGPARGARRREGRALRPRHPLHQWRHHEV